MPKISPIIQQTNNNPFGGTKIKAQTQTADILEHVAQKAAAQTSESVVESQGQPNTSEGSNTEATPLDPKFEALAKKEAAFRAKEREFQAKEAALKDRESKLGSDLISKADLLANPLEILNKIGVTYDQLVEQAVNMPDPNTLEIKNELKTLRENQAKLVEEAQNSAKAQRDAAIKQIRYDVTDLIDSDPQFETIQNTDSSEDVVELITRTFDETGKLLTVDQAAKMVEDELFAEALKIANLKKVQEKLKPQLSPEVIQQSKQQSSMQQQMTTLTNQMSTSRKLSPRERAILAFNNKLTKS